MQNTTNCRHPQHESYTSRLETYIDWPRRYVPKTPEELAAAGFFYIGSADRVTCFQCGITLRDWEEEHDPVAEHHRYSGNCQFINQAQLPELGVSDRPGLGNLDSLSTSTASPGNGYPTYNEDLGLGGGSCARPPTQGGPTRSGSQVADDKTRSGKCEDLGSFCAKVCQEKCEQSDFVTETVSGDSHTQAQHSTKKSGSKSKASSLLAENRRLKEEAACKRCKMQMACILFLPCGHLVTCSECAEKVEECIICNKTILGTVKTFKV